MIISAGYNIAGAEVEDVLLRHPAVAECGVVGRSRRGTGPDRRGLRRAEARRRSRRSRPRRTLQDYVKQRSRALQISARGCEFRDTLPRTETGKLQRFKLRQEASQLE